MTEVFVTIPKSKVVNKPTQTGVVKKMNTTEGNKIYMSDLNYGQGFKNGITDSKIIFYDAQTSPYLDTYGAVMNECGVLEGFPANVGIVKLKKKASAQEPMASFFNKQEYNVFDLIDVNEKRFFNSDRIALIEHFYGNWFVIGYDFYDGSYQNKLGQAKLYNVKTKQFIDIAEKDYNNVVSLGYYGFHGITSFIIQNYRFIHGSYQSLNTECYKLPSLSNSEIFMEKKLGGQDKWKAFIVVDPTPSKSSRNYNRFVYYCDANDRIIKLELTMDEAIELR
ncbi:hypothetical protein SGQ44_18120 [Flavobacterium sp. Fl-77]|uniref:WG repeat-containing protein n=1 Tax=Flavobacterium flavipigmentatum TaxID=2893884 RepID=A0AAJ2VY86_9FLAO|nr:MULTISPECIES: hypothetical protein [unclassified Flavobacterium]MDX6184083.1 hypothetical protein [Flavobacterium sp. Fl-33]MDX6187677.1 hypothetical protein [Flavobacterium sp. Fl-77]UFH39195.1 hypothetical protein LNP22_02700 [Flavobacterium sp. F-70]